MNGKGSKVAGKPSEKDILRRFVMRRVKMNRHTTGVTIEGTTEVDSRSYSNILIPLGGDP